MAGTYKSPYAKQLTAVTTDLLNRGKFAYDMNADAMYNLYKDQYMQAGNVSMRDTIGELAGQTGGMASSAAMNAGSSAYQAQLTALHDKVSDLYGQAQQKFNTDTQDLYNKFNLLYQADERAYQMHRDQVNDEFTERQLQIMKEKAGL